MTDHDHHVSLKEYIHRTEQTLTASIRLMQETIDRFTAQHDAAHQREHMMTDEAITKAEVSLSKQLASMSDITDQMRMDIADKISRAEFARFEESYRQAHTSLVDQVNEQRNMWSKLQGQMVLLIALPIILSMIATAIGLWQVLDG
jgi:hypothetical protein